MVGNFLVVEALAGGAMIGLAAVLLFILTGRIAGVSGMAGGLLAPGGGKLWRAAFLLGMIGGGLLLPFVLGRELEVDMQSTWPLTLAAGLLVGFGTRMGNGCTSGHGVCGMARFSPRSIAATICFIATGMLTVFVVRHLGASV